MKTYKLLYLLMVFVLFATCKKDRKRLFKTKVHGTVIDYFDLKPVEGVKVSVVYTYDFKEYSWPFNYPPPPGNTPPCVEPDTLEQTYTNANGEFELKFPVRKEVDICGISGNVVNEGTNYGYLLIFEKPGTDYFKQYHSLGFADKNNINVLYRIRPLVTLEFRIYTLTNQNENVGCGISTHTDFPLNKNYWFFSGASGQNLDTILIQQVPFKGQISSQLIVSGGFFDEQIKISVKKKYYQYEILY